jgi:flagellar hook-basal body complex protein FliE
LIVRSNYENSVASLLGQIQSNREHLDALRLDGAKSNTQLKVNDASSPSYAEIAKNALNEVSAVYDNSSALREAYDRGEDVPLTNVVLAMQKSSLAFESTLQVRNKVLKAYEDILNMPV